MDLSAAQGFVIIALSTVGGFFGAFLSSYFKTKGQNLATHEDIHKLVDQVRAVTTTAEEIEAKISDDVWDRQKRWELTRDAALETLKALAAVQDRLSQMHAVFTTDKTTGTPRKDKQIESYKVVNQTLDRLEQAALPLQLVAGEELHRAIRQFDLLSRTIASQIHEGHPEVFAQRIEEFVAKFHGIVELLRDGLFRSATKI